MLLVLGLAFLVVPIVELAVIVKVASEVGIAETIGLLILVSVVGAWLCKREGISAWRRISAAVERHELPHRELLDGALILFAGVLLLTPGFVTDVLGIVLLLPPTRALVRKIVERAIRSGSPFIQVFTVVGGEARSRGPVVDTTETGRGLGSGS